MQIPSISNLWRVFTKREPLVPKAAPATDSEHLLGSDDQAREQMQFSDRIRNDKPSLIYDQNAEIHDLNDEHHPKIDERM